MTSRNGYAGERRRGPDLWLRSLSWLGVLGWSFLVGSLFVVDKARPEIETFFDRYYHLRLRTTWDLSLTRYIAYLLLCGLALSLIGLGINLRRNRRSDDELRISLMLLGAVSAVGILKYLVSF